MNAGNNKVQALRESDQMFNNPEPEPDRRNKFAIRALKITRDHSSLKILTPKGGAKALVRFLPRIANP